MHYLYNATQHITVNKSYFTLTTFELNVLGLERCGDMVRESILEGVLMPASLEHQPSLMTLLSWV